MQLHFDDELQGLKRRILHMGDVAEKMIDIAIQCLVQRKKEIQPAFTYEEEVNNLHVEIDEEVVRLIALHNPVAKDLRFLLMASKIVNELERIGDQAINICQNTEHLLKYPLLKPLIDVPVMADTVREMLRESLVAFTQHNIMLAQKVLDTDNKVDAFKNQIFRELLTYMMSEPGTIPQAMALILISRNLERVGDHTTNIAEEVIYLEQGRDVRHHHEEKRRLGANDK